MTALPAILAVLVSVALVLLDVHEPAPDAHARRENAEVSAAGLFSALERGEVDPGTGPRRQRSAAMVLLVLTLIAAGVLGGGIYLGLSALR